MFLLRILEMRENVHFRMPVIIGADIIEQTWGLENWNDFTAYDSSLVLPPLGYSTQPGAYPSHPATAMNEPMASTFSSSMPDLQAASHPLNDGQDGRGGQNDLPTATALTFNPAFAGFPELSWIPNWLEDTPSFQQ